MSNYEKLQKWLVEHPIRSIWSKTPVGSGCDYGVNPENFPWVDLDLEGLEGEVENFKLSNDGKRCEFIQGYTWYILDEDKLPEDKWGNTATFSEGVNLQEGYFEIGYDCEGDCDCHLIDKDGDNVDFNILSWLIDKYPELVAVVGEETICNGTTESWHNYTTNLSLTDTKWQEIIEEYYNSDD